MIIDLNTEPKIDEGEERERDDDHLIMSIYGNLYIL